MRDYPQAAAATMSFPRILTWIGLLVSTIGWRTAEGGGERDARDYWSYRPVERPAVPHAESLDRSDGALPWSCNPIDAFILAEQAKHGLKPSPPAEPAVLLRRVYLDLIGVPPTREELHVFLANPSDGEYVRVVDRLLASPQYGERWGRHWMDVWRYSDWYGSRNINEIRYSQRHIWRWRDWIIDSLNADKGYDRMILEMLAGDELAAADPAITRATGFIARNWYKFDRNVWMFDAVEHTAQAFLGLTLRCARCHDHKYDPISQQDYYRFRAFFEPHDIRTDPLSGTTGTEKDATLGQVLTDGLARVYDKQLDTPTFVFTRGDNRYPDEQQRMDPGVPAAFGLKIGGIERIPLPMDSYAPWLRNSFVAEKIDSANRVLNAAESRVTETRSAIVAAERRLADWIDRESSGLEAEQSRGGNFFADHSPYSALTKREVETSLKVAQRSGAAAMQSLHLARAERTALETRIVADRANLSGSADAEVTAHRAATAERQAKLVQAELEAMLAEHACLSARASLSDLRTALSPNGPPSGNAGAEARKKALAEAEAKVTATRKAVDAARAEAAKQDAAYTPLGPTYPRSTTGRRLALARWITDPCNPRSARIAVNHIWLHHFGQAIVPSVANFGINGSTPSHPQLLDWLAAEFVEQGWSMKGMHRLMVTSNTYRQASKTGDFGLRVSDSDTGNPPCAFNPQSALNPQSATPNPQWVDPENRFLWRMNSRRMESEAVRDSILWVGRRLDTTFGGPEIAESQGQDTCRRSIYFRSTPNEKMSMLEVFDQANPNECYRRQESVMPQQALALSNSALCLNQSRLLARQLTSEVGAADSPATVAPFIVAAFEQILSRPPNDAEVTACEEFLARHAALIRDGRAKTSFPPANGPAASVSASDPQQHARENLVHVLFNHNDFVTIR